MQSLNAKKEAYYLAVDNTNYPQNMKKYIKKLISNCGSPEEIFQLTLFYLYNCQTAQLPAQFKNVSKLNVIKKRDARIKKHPVFFYSLISLKAQLLKTPVTAIIESVVLMIVSTVVTTGAY